MSSTTASDSLKKVMRIALVGIRPGDQVMLKGYLRILLRLEADLEWVSANHQIIDLFMINNEFKHSDSVQRLLASKPSTASLYIDRNEVTHGQLTGNTLVIPLKELDPLKAWLFGNVTFLSGQSSPSRTTIESAHQTVQTNNTNTQSPEPTQTTKTKTLDEILASRLVNKSSSAPIPPTATIIPTATSSETQATSESMSFDFSKSAVASPSFSPEVSEYAKAFATVIIRLQQREDILLAVKNQTELLAYIHPKQQRIWVMSHNLEIEQPWQLSAVEENVTTNPAQSQDLVQWLWQFAIARMPSLQVLLDETANYHLTSWARPLHNDKQHSYLKIQGSLESRHLTLPQIAQVSQSPLTEVKEAVLGLLAAGLMPSPIYQNLTNHLQQRAQAPKHTEPNHSVTPTMEKTAEVYSKNPATSIPTTPHTDTHSADEPTQQTNITTQPVTNAEPQSVTQAQSTSQPANDSGSMMGFLSKLRRRLGL